VGDLQEQPEPGGGEVAALVPVATGKVIPLPEPHEPLVGARRFMRAYKVTFQVIWSYLWARVWGRVLGAEWLKGALNRAHLKNARRVERTILELQGLFIKAGQVISVMTNFLPAEFRTGLEGLQDQVPPRPFAQIRKRIVADLGKPPDELFREFDEDPIASASIAQVHVARLEDGSKVAVKVQHHDLERLVVEDMGTIRRIMSIVQAFLPVSGLDAFYKELRQMIEHEMDFTEEAKAIVRISGNFVGNEMVRFPKIYQELSSSHVLTSEFMEGCKISDIEALEAMGVDRRALARHVVTTYCQMIFIDGEYHADPHPGNLLVQPDGGVVFLDFGAVATLSPGMRKGIIDFLTGVIKRDTDKIVSALRSMGFIAHSAHSEVVSEKVVEHFHARFQEEVRLDSFNLKDIRFDPQMGFDGLMDLSRMDVGLRELTGAFHVPKEWVLLERTVLLLTGVCSLLDPKMNPTEVIRPYMEEFVLGKDREWTELLLEAAKDTMISYLALPAEIQRYISRAIRGELVTRPKGLRQGFLLMYALGHQLIYTLGGIALAAGGLVFYRDGHEVAALGCASGVGVFVLLTVLSMILAFRHIPPR
jgi:predicted unusual protein kinase regulating ubiquinone biosynthesis (AarF/ABC1/UbiB family)